MEARSHDGFREAGGSRRGSGRARREGRLSARRGGILSLAIASLLLVALAANHGHGGKNPAAVERLASLEVGQWVHIEGSVRADSAGRCDELRLLTGDLLDDDWALKGFVQAVDTLKREFTIGGVRAQASADTRFDSPKKNFRRLAELRAGLLVEIEGTWLKSGRFLAHEVDDETDELARTPWARNRVMAVGRVERVDARKRLVTVMGLVFEVTERTRLRSVIE
jgi:hypothetical protein